jgi:hypothetical protein
MVGKTDGSAGLDFGRQRTTYKNSLGNKRMNAIATARAEMKRRACVDMHVAVACGCSDRKGCILAAYVDLAAVRTVRIGDRIPNLGQSRLRCDGFIRKPSFTKRPLIFPEMTCQDRESADA